MSRAYRNSSDVPLDAIIKRLHELSDAVVGGRKTQAQEFVMRIPAECDHDADLVLAEAAVRLDALRKYNAELQAENDNLRKANQDCVAWEKSCKADLDRALARVVELESQNEALRQQLQQLMTSEWKVAVDYAESFIMRKQAEAVDEAQERVTLADSRREMQGAAGSYAAELRQQADEMDGKQQ